ncbi:MAG: DUF3786 domain-containing protein [Desulfomonile tiedjei]|uniref:DUF3786 domain-containing protein n=1 Tax=Desulfomonile tiedjei TaxID=2358 RepID=A0A9D6Z712_9BACT|nr:DUF3786 domain-containing protein [Desulfomonile tiedjei]
MLNIKDLSSPELPTQDNYEQALRIGLEIFDRRDPGRVAEKARARLVGRSIIIPYLDREIALNVDTHRFSFTETDEEAPTWLAILAIHYLNNADGRHPTGRLKHFREFKDGHFYEPAFNRRTKDILASVFGLDPAPMTTAAEKLKGKLLQTGDAAVELSYFPCVPITCILWRGDEEFPAEATVLFDETADTFFSAEDMAVAGQMAVLELLKASRG